ncbi:MAG: hypothetical protein ACPLSY_03415 [Moorellaceae bacterium]
MKVTPEELEKYLGGQGPAGKAADDNGKNNRDTRGEGSTAGDTWWSFTGESGSTAEPLGADGTQVEQQQGSPDSAAIAEMFRADIEAEEAALPKTDVFRLVINHDTGTFDFPDGLSTSTVEGFLVGWSVRRLRWAEGRIACLSRDGKRGRLADGKVVECELCTHKARCSQSVRLYFIPSLNARELFYFDVPSGQLNAFSRYVRSVHRGSGGEDRPAYAVVTRVRLEKWQGWRAARLFFEVARIADKQEWEEIRVLRNELLPYVMEEDGGDPGETAKLPSLEDVVF